MFYVCIMKKINNNLIFYLKARDLNMIHIAIQMLPVLLVKWKILYNVIASLTFNCNVCESIVYLGLVY